MGAQVRGAGAAKFRDRRLPDIALYGATANYASLMNLDIASGRFFLDSEARTAAGGRGDRLGRQGRALPAARPARPHRADQRRPLPRHRPAHAAGEDARPEPRQRDLSADRPPSARASAAAPRSISWSRRAAGSTASTTRPTRCAPCCAPCATPISALPTRSASSPPRACRRSGARSRPPAFLLTMLIASVSLGVGGIVIMNIMLVAVAERTAGDRPAAGARGAPARRPPPVPARGGAAVAGRRRRRRRARRRRSRSAVDRLAHFPRQPTPGIASWGSGSRSPSASPPATGRRGSASNLLPVDALRAE